MICTLLASIPRHDLLANTKLNPEEHLGDVLTLFCEPDDIYESETC